MLTWPLRWWKWRYHLGRSSSFVTILSILINEIKERKKSINTLQTKPLLYSCNFITKLRIIIAYSIWSKLLLAHKIAHFETKQKEIDLYFLFIRIHLFNKESYQICYSLADTSQRFFFHEFFNLTLCFLMKMVWLNLAYTKKRFSTKKTPKKSEFSRSQIANQHTFFTLMNYNGKE